MGHAQKISEIGVMNRLFTLIIFFFLAIFQSHAQTTFQKIYTSDGDVECFGAYQTTDNGYIFTGIATVNGTQKIFMLRTDCHGEMQWGKTYNSTSSWNNISQRVIETHDHAGDFNEVVSAERNKKPPGGEA